MLDRVLAIAVWAATLTATGGLAAAQFEALLAPNAEELTGRFVFWTGRTHMQLDLRSDGRFDLAYGGCVSDDRYEGRVDVVDGNLVLASEIEVDLREGGPPRPSTQEFGPFVPVRWGQRLYLVDRDEAEAFCDAVNSGAEPRLTEGHRFTTALLRDDDWRREAKGDPDVPAEWRELLLPRPIAGAVLSVEADGSAVIGLGSEDGVRPGMRLTRHFVGADDWAVPQGQPWRWNAEFVVAAVDAQTCRMAAGSAARQPFPGQLVTGRVPTTVALPLAIWRRAGEDRQLTFEPLAPLPGTSQPQLDAWTEQIRTSFSPGVPLEPPPSAHVFDQLTPAFFNALRGLDMGSPFDIDKARAILEVWKGYGSQCIGERRLVIDFDGRDVPPTRQLEHRIWELETFVMWWREMSADPQRLADFQRGRAP